MGYIYLLQPAELVGTDRYKIGISSKDNLNRLRSYGNGTRYMFLLECDDFFRIENRLKKAFNECRDIKLIKGFEYFEGKQEIIMKIFFKVVYEDKIKDFICQGDSLETIGIKNIEVDDEDVEMEDVTIVESNNNFISGLQKFKFK
jgi:T5orf172 domain